MNNTLYYIESYIPSDEDTIVGNIYKLQKLGNKNIPF